MEYLFQINPILKTESEIIIYGIGEESKRIFFALLQQDISVNAFCLKRSQKTRLNSVFGKRIYTLQELAEEHIGAYVIMSAQDLCKDGELLRKEGINIIMENITAENMGLLLEED